MPLIEFINLQPSLWVLNVDTKTLRKLQPGRLGLLLSWMVAYPAILRRLTRLGCLALTALVTALVCRGKLAMMVALQTAVIVTRNLLVPCVLRVGLRSDLRHRPRDTIPSWVALCGVVRVGKVRVGTTVVTSLVVVMLVVYG